MIDNNRCPHCGQALSPSPALTVDDLRDWCRSRGHVVYPIDRVKPATAAELLGISVNTLRNRRSMGEGPLFVRTGRNRITYQLHELMAEMFPNNHEV
jgi:hypothetical protein